MSWNPSGLFLSRNIVIGFIIFVEDKTLWAFHIASVFVLGPGHLNLMFLDVYFVWVWSPIWFSGNLVLFLLFVCILCYPIFVDFITGRKGFKFSLSDTCYGLVNGEAGMIPVWRLPVDHTKTHHVWLSLVFVCLFILEWFYFLLIYKI